MIYLQRPNTADIAACETPDHAARYEAAGYVRVTFAAFRTAWRQRDEALIQQLRPQAQPVTAPELLPLHRQHQPPADEPRTVYGFPVYHG